MYKLTRTENSIMRLSDGVIFPQVAGNMHYEDYLTWVSEGNTVLPADELTPAQIAKEEETSQAHPIAKTWFSGQAAAIAFIRQTPEQQATQISGMTVAQKDTVLKYLAIAVSMLIKERLL